MIYLYSLFQSGRLIPHGNGGPYNTAGNDLYIDGNDVEIDGAPTVSLEFNEAFTDSNASQHNREDSRICPRSVAYRSEVRGPRH